MLFLETDERDLGSLGEEGLNINDTSFFSDFFHKSLSPYRALWYPEDAIRALPLVLTFHFTDVTLS